MHTLSSPLTRREQEVLFLVTLGHTDHKVGEILTISTRTVNRHLSNILNKLAVSSRTAATAYAIRYGLCDSHSAVHSF
jgi:DNA-binding NarL/FixJ family response regulator